MGGGAKPGDATIARRDPKALCGRARSPLRLDATGPGIVVRKGVFLLRLEMRRDECFVEVAEISNRFQLRFEIRARALRKTGWDALGGNGEAALDISIYRWARVKASLILPHSYHEIKPKIQFQNGKTGAEKDGCGDKGTGRSVYSTGELA